MSGVAPTKVLQLETQSGKDESKEQRTERGKRNEWSMDREESEG